MSNMDVEHLGQVFTPARIVTRMLGLRKNNGSVLEPSCGDGAFSNRIPGCVAVELDPTKCPDGALNMDFFDYGVEHKFDTIIGNPPYVRFQDIPPETKGKLDMTLFDGRSNLALFFIEKCLRHLNDHGELIFIVPRDFIKATSAAKMNALLYRSGTVTDFIELGDMPVFDGASPNTVIFRYVKGDMSHAMSDGRLFKEVNGQLLFVSGDYAIPFGDLFFVKVGAVSGADRVFVSDNGNLDFVCSTTRKTGLLRRAYYGDAAKALTAHKDELIGRRIRKFDDSNWWQYGRDYYHSDAERVYVNAKTRNKDPFFYHEGKAYDGSVLAIFARFDMDADLAREVANDLNGVDWEELGFICDGRYLFSQKSLEDTLLPESFRKYYERLPRTA